MNDLDIAMVISGTAAWCAGVTFLWTRWRRRPSPRPSSADGQIEVVSAILQVPRFFTDGHPVQPCELLAASHIVAHQVEHLAAGLYSAAMDAILAQVAAAEAGAGLDQAIERIIRDGAR